MPNKKIFVKPEQYTADKYAKISAFLILIPIILISITKEIILLDLLLVGISVILFLYFKSKLKLEQMQLRLTGIISVLLITFIISLNSISMNAESISSVGEALVVASSIVVLIGLEFYKNTSQHILSTAKTDWSKESLNVAIKTTFFPIISAILALISALLALINPSINTGTLLINFSILLMLAGALMSVELSYERIAKKMGLFDNKIVSKK